MAMPENLVKSSCKDPEFSQYMGIENFEVFAELKPEQHEYSFCVKITALKKCFIEMTCE